MIPFIPKRTDDLTYFFFAKRNLDDFMFVLRKNMVTGWGIYPLLKVKHRLPNGTIIPEVKRVEDGVFNAHLGEILVFVSFYDAKEVEELYWEILKHPDTMARHSAQAEEANHNIAWREKFEDDPAPWGFSELRPK